MSRSISKSRISPTMCVALIGILFLSQVGWSGLWPAFPPLHGHNAELLERGNPPQRLQHVPHSHHAVLQHDGSIIWYTSYPNKQRVVILSFFQEDFPKKFPFWSVDSQERLEKIYPHSLFCIASSIVFSSTEEKRHLQTFSDDLSLQEYLPSIDHPPKDLFSPCLQA